MAKYEITNKLLKIDYLNGNEITYNTFKTTNTSVQHYKYVVERKNYFELTLWSGDFQKFYKNENKVEHVNTVTNEVKDITSRIKYEILTTWLNILTL